MKKPLEIIEDLRFALETRNYTDFVNCFAENGVLELPFALPDSPCVLKELKKSGSALAIAANCSISISYLNFIK